MKRYQVFIIGITHVFSCINISPVPRKLFEHEADRRSAQTSPKGPDKCRRNDLGNDQSGRQRFLYITSCN